MIPVILAIAGIATLAGCGATLNPPAPSYNSKDECIDDADEPNTLENLPKSVPLKEGAPLSTVTFFTSQKESPLSTEIKRVPVQQLDLTWRKAEEVCTPPSRFFPLPIGSKFATEIDRKKFEAGTMVGNSFQSLRPINDAGLLFVTCRDRSKKIVETTEGKSIGFPEDKILSGLKEILEPQIGALKEGELYLSSEIISLNPETILIPYFAKNSIGFAKANLTNITGSLALVKNNPLSLPYPSGVTVEENKIDRPDDLVVPFRISDEKRVYAHIRKENGEIKEVNFYPLQAPIYSGEISKKIGTPLSSFPSQKQIEAGVFYVGQNDFITLDFVQYSLPPTEYGVFHENGLIRMTRYKGGVVSQRVLSIIAEDDHKQSIGTIEGTSWLTFVQIGSAEENGIKIFNIDDLNFTFQSVSLSLANFVEGGRKILSRESVYTFDETIGKYTRVDLDHQMGFVDYSRLEKAPAKEVNICQSGVVNKNLSLPQNSGMPRDQLVTGLEAILYGETAQLLIASLYEKERAIFTRLPIGMPCYLNVGTTATSCSFDSGLDRPSDRTTVIFHKNGKELSIGYRNSIFSTTLE